MSVKEKQTLKSLETQLKIVDGDINALNTQKRNLLEDLSNKNRQKQKLKAEIERIKYEEPEVFISDHAIVRFMERIEGVDIAEIKKRMVGERISASIKTLGDGSFPSEDGTCTLRVKDKVVVTILNNE